MKDKITAFVAFVAVLLAGGAAVVEVNVIDSNANHVMTQSAPHPTDGLPQPSLKTPAESSTPRDSRAPHTTTPSAVKPVVALTGAPSPSAAPTPVATAPAPTPTGSGCDPSGQPMPVGNLPGWDQVVADDFCYTVPLGSFPNAVSNIWGAYADGWHDTSGNGVYDCTLVCSVHNGVLDLWLHTVNGVHYVAAPYPLIPDSSAENGMLYGRYVVRFEATSVVGYKTAWLLWPDNDVWPEDGEIDFPEGDIDNTFCAYMHLLGATVGSEQDAYCTPDTYTSWHTAVIQWSPGSCTFTLDGQVIGVATADIPDTSMHWVLQTETALDSPPPSDTASGHVYIAWVAIYRPG